MQSKSLNTVISYGLTATVMQCAAYNHAISETYKYYKKGKNSEGQGGLIGFLQSNVIPGVIFSFLRECFATGAGLVLGPVVRELLAPLMGGVSPLLAKIISGIGKFRYFSMFSSQSVFH